MSQLALDDRWTETARPRSTRREPEAPVLCAGCRSREARYGFRSDNDEPPAERTRTLCFECFRIEIGRRQARAHAVQVRLPLETTIDSLRRRRGRAQIAARKALELR